MTPTPPTDTTAALSAERTLEEMQALRQSVRDKLYGALPGNLAALADYLRVPSLLDEGDELQRRLEAVSPWDAGREAQRSQLQLDYFTMKQRAEVAEAALVLEKRRAGEFEAAYQEASEMAWTDSHAAWERIAREFRPLPDELE